MSRHTENLLAETLSLLAQASKLLAEVMRLLHEEQAPAQPPPSASPSPPPLPAGEPRFPPGSLIRMPTVLTMTGLKHSQLYCLIAEGQFPAPVNIGARAVAWRIEDVQAWTGSRSRARHAGRVQLTDSQATVVARKRVTVPANPSMYPPLDAEVRDTVSTDAAAFYLGRRPQTLRSWATYENGPLRPMRVNGRLAWPVAEIKRVLAGRPRRSSPDAAQ